MKHIKLCFALALMFLVGCTAIESREACPNLAQGVQSRTGAKIYWRDGSEADRAVDRSIDEMLTHELNVDSALQIALLNNRSIQATYEELGIAQAELVEAGLISNPIFDALVKFGDDGTNLDLSITQNFIQLLSIPLRQRIASAKYESAQARVASEVIELAAEVQKSFFDCQADQQSLALHRAKLDLVESASIASERLRDAGNITEQDLLERQAEFGEAKLELSRAELRAMRSREKLTTLLGLWGSRVELRIADRLPEMPSGNVDLKNIESLAIPYSNSLQEGLSKLNEKCESLGMARKFAWSDLEASVAAEHDTDGEWLVGPGVSVPIPIFNTGAANLTIARAELRQALHRLYVQTVQIQSQARVARSELSAAQNQVNFLKTSIVPLRERATQQAQLRYNAMQIGIFDLLEAKQDEIESNERYIDSLRDYWIARVEVERLIGRKLSESESPPTPTTQPQTEHHDH